MTRLDSTDRSFAICLSALAGYVDAVGFLMTGGYFVSFMSGNTTRLGVGLGAMSSEAGVAARLIVMFVGGVAIGTLVGRSLGRWRRSGLLALIALLIAASAWLGTGDHAGLAIALIALAMGAENTVLGDDEGAVGITYMTGTLVKIGRGFAGAIAGGPPWAWVPNLLLWTGLLSGAWIGAVLYFRWQTTCLWLVVAGLIALALASLPRRGPAA
ncbi:YoaK family protein [Sphingomonas sp. GlSt437]